MGFLGRNPGCPGRSWAPSRAGRRRDAQRAVTQRRCRGEARGQARRPAAERPVRPLRQAPATHLRNASQCGLELTEHRAYGAAP